MPSWSSEKGGAFAFAGLAEKCQSRGCTCCANWIAPCPKTPTHAGTAPRRQREHSDQQMWIGRPALIQDVWAARVIPLARQPGEHKGVRFARFPHGRPFLTEKSRMAVERANKDRRAPNLCEQGPQTSPDRWLQPVAHDALRASLIWRPCHRVNAHGDVAVSLTGISRRRTSSGSTYATETLFCRGRASKYYANRPNIRSFTTRTDDFPAGYATISILACNPVALMAPSFSAWLGGPINGSIAVAIDPDARHCRVATPICVPAIGARHISGVLFSRRRNAPHHFFFAKPTEQKICGNLGYGCLHTRLLY